MAVKLANNAISTLAASITAASTSLSVQGADAGKFPALSGGDWHPATIIDIAGNMEIIKVTAREGAVLTIDRAQEGTTAKAFAAGSRIDVRLTAAVVNDIYSSFYTKAQIDATFADHYTKAQIDATFADHYTKAQIDTSLASVGTALGGKVAKAGDTITGNLAISAGTEELLTIKNTSAATGADARIVLRARNRSDNTYAEIGQRSNGHGYFWVAEKSWEFRSDGYIALPDGGSVSPRGDLYIANYGGLSDWIMAIISRSKNIRLSNVGWWDRPAGQGAPDHNMGNGQVMTGLGGGFDGRVHSAYFRQIQQTDLWGNWYGVGSM